MAKTKRKKNVVGPFGSFGKTKSPKEMEQETVDFAKQAKKGAADFAARTKL